MTCIELNPYFGIKITHEIYCFRSVLVLFVCQAPPKEGACVEHQKWRTVTPQCHLGFFSVLAQVPSFHVSKIEQEASNQLENKRSTKLHLKNHVQNK
jgi:hypothetical protein